jgi:mRNA interferase MazF
MLKTIFKVLVSCACLTLAVATVALAAPTDQPKTGQTICYDASGAVISCTNTGQDGALQKGVAWPSPRFTTNADTSVTDNLTGLVWAPNGNLMPTQQRSRGRPVLPGRYMRRGELYRVYKGSPYDTRKYRVFVVVSRRVLIDSKFSTVVCAPVYSSYDGLSTQVLVGVDEGLKREGSVHCDELVSIPQFLLSHYAGSLSFQKNQELDEALKVALALS